MRRTLTLVLLLASFALLAGTATALAGEDEGGQREGPPSAADRVEELQQELDSLEEDVDDLREPVEEFELFDQCMYLIGVTQYGRANGSSGYLFGDGGRQRRPALALDIRGFHQPEFLFLSFPGEEPPSIECNEDAGQELIDD